MKSTSTRKTNRFQFAATIFGALAIAVLAPATAHAQPVGSTGAGGGCHYTDKDGYDIPIDDGQAVIVDGKTVTCSGGTITVSNVGPKKPVLNQRVPVTLPASSDSAYRDRPTLEPRFSQSA